MTSCKIPDYLFRQQCLYTLAGNAGCLYYSRSFSSFQMESLLHLALGFINFMRCWSFSNLRGKALISLSQSCTVVALLQGDFETSDSTKTYTYYFIFLYIQVHNFSLKKRHFTVSHWHIWIASITILALQDHC